MYNMFFSISALIFLILIIIVFYSKKRIDNLENKTLSLLLVINLIGTTLSILGIALGMSGVSGIVLNIVYKLFFAYLVTIPSIFIFYILNILFNIENKKNIKIIFVSISLIVSILCLVLPIDIVKEDLVIKLSGLSISVCTSFVITSYIASIVLFIVGIKRILNKKIIPMLVFVLFGLFSFGLNAILPGVWVINFVYVISTIIMFFCIDNLDFSSIQEIEKAREKAQKASEVKTDFLSSMSHEIRTTLNSIIGFSECINQEETLEDAKKDANYIMLAGQNLLGTLNGILDISKIEENKMEISESDYNPVEVFENIASFTKPRIGEKNIDLETNISEDIPFTLHGDISKVKQITTNLLNNVIDCSKKGTVKFDVSCVNEDEFSKLKISIESTDTVVEPEKVNRLFTRFENFDEESNVTIEVTGLNFAITKSLVDMMGGKISIKSENGTKIDVYISQKIVLKDTPLINEIAKLEEKIKPRDNNYSGKCALIVDDDRINLKVVSRILKTFNIETVEVESGIEAIKNIEDGNNYDLILMDDIMPEMSGVETFKILKELESFNIPVIAITANTSIGIREKYMDLGFNDYLEKPIEKSELIRILSDLFDDDEYDFDIDSFGPISEDMFNEFMMQEIEKEISETKDTEDEFYKNKNFLIKNNVDVKSATELLKGMSTYDESLQIFIEDSYSTLEELKKYGDENVLSKCLNIVRTLKVDAKYLGFMELSKLSGEIEDSIKKNNMIVKFTFERLISEFERIIDISKKYLGL
ncbi:MAG: response regulator [Clostridium sp.]|nr:response regulator [Clostridium sp.]MCM1444498.1 response regulator [Candidatus Amulumruptor caecigallinarius]